MTIDATTNNPPTGPLTTVNPDLSPALNSVTGSLALTLADLYGLTALAAITIITCAISDVLNSAFGGALAARISVNQHQQYMDQAWETAINAAVSNAGADADDSTEITMPTSVTLADGTTSYIGEYLAERPNFESYFNGQSSLINLSDYSNAVSEFSKTPLLGQDYGSMIDAMISAIQTYGDPSKLPQPAPPPLPVTIFTSNSPVPPAYADYAKKVADLFTSQNIINNPAFMYQGALTITIANSKNLSADINASATNFMTTLQQLTNELQSMVSSLATFCAAMAKCQQNCLKAPGS